MTEFAWLGAGLSFPSCRRTNTVWLGGGKRWRGETGASPEETSQLKSSEVGEWRPRGWQGSRWRVAGGWRIGVGVARRMRTARGSAALCGLALGRRQRKDPWRWGGRVGP
jgi:hypothetical protein